MDCQITSFSPTRDYKINTFRKDIKEFIEQAGSLYKKTTLLLTDNNVVANFILEDIDSLLNNGEIPKLFDTNEMSNIQNRVQTNDNFVRNIRDYLHIAFCTSPVGETLKTRFRKFPSLINCCVLDWYINWPKEALVACCEKTFSELSFSPIIKESLVRISAQIHEDIEHLTTRYKLELGRQVYVTPKSFLDMNSLFLAIVSKKKDEFESTIVN